MRLELLEVSRFFRFCESRLDVVVVDVVVVDVVDGNDAGLLLVGAAADLSAGIRIDDMSSWISMAHNQSVSQLVS